MSTPAPYYEDGRAAVFHGRAEDVVPALGLRFDALIGDPPYGVRERVRRAAAGRGNRKTLVGGWSGPARDWPAIEGDDRPFDPAPWLAMGVPRVVLWGANHYADRLPPAPSWLVWDKRVDTGPNDNADCELAWSNLGGPARIFRHLWRGICRAGEENVSRSPLLHPMQKPVALMRWVVGLCKLPPDSLILDPWTGSGPLAQAAVEAGHRVVACDVAEWCCEIAASRLRGLDSVPLVLGVL